MSSLVVIQQPQATALVTVERAAADLGLSLDAMSDDDKARLSDVIEDVSSMVAEFVGIPEGLGQQVVSETFSIASGDMAGGDINLALPYVTFGLRLRPVIEVQGVTVNGRPHPASSLDLDTRGGYLTFRQDALPVGIWGAQSLTVIYKGGWVLPSFQATQAASLPLLGPSLPRWVQRAVLMQVSDTWLRTGVNSRSSDILLDQTEDVGRVQYAPSTGSALIQPVMDALNGLIRMTL